VRSVVTLILCLAAAAGQAADPPSRADVEALLARRAFVEAEAAARAHLAAVETAHGSESLATADALDLLTLVLVGSERAAPPETITLLERAVTIRERLQGADSPALADSLREIGKLATASNQLDKAASCLGRAQSIYRQQLGEEDGRTIEVTVVLASVSYRRGDYQAARALLEAVLPVQERLFGPEDAKVAGTLNGLASTLYQLGEYTPARELWERALEIRRRTLGPDDPALAQSLNNVALACYREGDFVGALQQYREALAHRRRTLPPTDPRIGYSLNGCAYTLSRTGDLGAARDLFEQALAIFEPALGPEHPETVQTLDALAGLVIDSGDLETGLALAERAAAGAIKAFGPRHHTTCTIRASYGSALLDANRPADARREVEAALAILREVLGPDHEEIAKALMKLAAVDEREGKLDSALAHLEEARQIREHTLGPNHPYVADCLHRQSRITRLAGRPGPALTLAERGLSIRERILGPDAPEVAESLLAIAHLQREVARPDRALAAAIGAEDVGRRHFVMVVQVLSEREALRYARLRVSALDLLLELASTRDAGAPAVTAAWLAVSRSRALVLEEMAERRRIAGSHEAEVGPLVGELATARENYLRLVIRGLGDETPERFAALATQARERLDAAERALAQRSRAFRTRSEGGALGFADLAGARPTGTALVTFARRTPDGKEQTAKPGPQVLAFVLPAGSQAVPGTVSLGPAATIETLVGDWRRAVLLGAGRDEDAASEGSSRVAGEALRRAVWDPVAAAVGDASRILLVPDGVLQLVNFAALPVGRTGYLAEQQPTFHLLTSERDLVARAAPARPGQGLLAMGAPAFDLAAEVRTPGTGLPVADDLFRGEVSACREFRSLRFHPLPGTAAEIDEVSRTWPAPAGPTASGAVVRLTGAEATETAFKRLAPGRDTLHLATHAFFLGPTCRAPAEGERGVGGLAPALPAAAASASSENPLHLSGLILAGANRRLESRPGEDDGVLTAEEVAALDLEGVEWAVLSGCDTGVGVVDAGEGVLGLRRAFRVAGVRTTIMSLWPVHDQATREWMRALYVHRLDDRLDTAEAVRRATRDVLAARRARGDSTHPFYWGAFIAAGDWR
jgi:CHAT domain-containing protein/tetratricopeptide (TPR) repeat protein